MGKTNAIQYDRQPRGPANRTWVKARATSKPAESVRSGGELAIQVYWIQRGEKGPGEMAVADVDQSGLPAQLAYVFLNIGEGFPLMPVLKGCRRKEECGK